MKRFSFDSHQSHEEARVKLKHQILLQDYLELQKEFVSKKKKLQTAKLNRGTLLAEVRFLRRRRSYLLNFQSAKVEPELVQLQQQTSEIHSKSLANESEFIVNEAVLENQPPVLDMMPTSNVEKGELRREEGIVWEPLRVEKKKPKKCLINDKRVEKKKISWQDQVALKVQI